MPVCLAFVDPSACMLEKAMAPHSSTLAWKIPWMEEPGRLQSMGLLRVGNDWATSLSLLTFMHRRRKWQPTPVFLPGESQGQEPGGLPSTGLHSVRHDWSNLAAAATCTWRPLHLLHLGFLSPSPSLLDSLFLSHTQCGHCFEYLLLLLALVKG